MESASASGGVSAMPTAMPSMLASVVRPTAVARCRRSNQCAGILVHALSRNGCATAMAIVASSTSV